MSNFFKKAVVYKAGEVKDSVQFEYVKKNGIFKVTLNRLLGVDSGTSVQVHMDFAIVGTDQVISCKELTEYTDKKTGQAVESKGSNIIRAMVGMASGKADAKSQWTSEKGKVFGKDVEGFTLPSLLNKEFYVSFQVERTVYNGKAYEDATMRRVLSAEGLSLAEYEDALGQVKDGTIKKTSEYVGKELDKEQGKTRKYRYKTCTDDEWNEANGGTTDTKYNDSDDTIPQIDEDILPDVNMKEEEPIKDESPKAETKDNGDGLPVIDIELS